MPRINVSKLGDEISRIMTEYSGVVYGDLEAAVEETSKTALSEIKSNALRYGWKDYAKTWTRKKEAKNLSYTVIVHAKGQGSRLAHLLEKGHAKRGGGRTRAFPHIAPAEKNAESNLIRALRQKIGGQ